jgi:hypothetical protein
MSTAAHRPADFVADHDYPSPVVRVIGFGFSDGVTDGVLRTADGTAYRFELAGEEHNPDGLDDRTFLLRPLPPGAFEEVADLLAPAGGPDAAVWVPRWPVAPPDRQAEIDRRLDALLASAGPPAWRVRCRSLTDTVSAAPAA